MGILSENPFAQAIAVSTSMALFMIGVAMGIMTMLSPQYKPLPFAMILLIFAVIFIAASVFFENRGADHVGSLIGGGIAAFAVTFAVTAFFTGILYVVSNIGIKGIGELGWDTIVSALAICMIASMLIIKAVQHKGRGNYL
ncbi:heat-shock protein [uncultured Methanomethylovorans sp.]|uniref:heat-shock protein n=1 Tax=uncultured Methanomethylovorans sp. TaxID=183759 RepID=UPI002AA65783|nr:heat-shock protein [uncultured Methanomethylovorans sp.]